MKVRNEGSDNLTLFFTLGLCRLVFSMMIAKLTM